MATALLTLISTAWHLAYPTDRRHRGQPAVVTLASRTAQAESSKSGAAGAWSAEIPTRQLLSSRTGEPNAVASKIAGAELSLPEGSGCLGLAGLNKSLNECFGAGGC